MQEATILGLHCIICFEEFNSHSRYPVVLPCGHTYVCCVCSKRLTKCMECREPLVWKPPTAVPPPQTAPTSRRYRHNSRPQTPPQEGAPPAQAPVPSIPLPMPKNVVLLEMIEASERLSLQNQSKAVGRSVLDEEEDEEDDDQVYSDDEDEDEDYIARRLEVKAGLTALTSPCGTYAVREPQGLVVLPLDPNRSHQHLEEKKISEEQVVIVASHSAPDDEDPPLSQQAQQQEIQEPYCIPVGSFVQVVSISKDGVYKLAHSKGYIVASLHQLVKVGPPLDDTCRLEGLMEAAKVKQRHVQRDMQLADLVVRRLESDLKKSKEKAVSPVVVSLPETSDATGTSSQSSAKDRLTTPRSPTPPTPLRDNDAENHATISPCTPAQLHLSTSSYSTEVEYGGYAPSSQPNRRSMSPGVQSTLVYLDSPAHSCPMPLRNNHDANTPSPSSGVEQPYLDDDVDRPLGLPSYRVSNDDEFIGFPTGFVCGSSLFGERLLDNRPSDLPRHPPRQGQQQHRAGDGDQPFLSLSFDDSMVESRHPPSVPAAPVAATTPPSDALRSNDVHRRRPQGHVRILQAPPHVLGEDFASTPQQVISPEQQQQQQQLRSGSFDGVDFRTGMSGHRGLNAAHNKKKSPSARRNLRFMSVHGGVTAPKINRLPATAGHRVLRPPESPHAE